ncbi:hypothetical protein ACFV5J_24240 [Streptomyces zaomyceticus]|uniref:hypothetical protein n=1 Tax=Streptomyces zaomyceticus TaxID=68286 RepID=UPI003647ED34
MTIAAIFDALPFAFADSCAESLAESLAESKFLPHLSGTAGFFLAMSARCGEGA